MIGIHRATDPGKMASTLDFCFLCQPRDRGRALCRLPVADKHMRHACRKGLADRYLSMPVNENVKHCSRNLQRKEETFKICRQIF